MSISKILNLLNQHSLFLFFEVFRLQYFDIINDFIAIFPEDYRGLDLCHTWLSFQSIEGIFGFVRTRPHFEISLTYHPHFFLLNIDYYTLICYFFSIKSDCPCERPRCIGFLSVLNRFSIAQSLYIVKAYNVFLR
jgi:hypothetical protein